MTSGENHHMLMAFRSPLWILNHNPTSFLPLGNTGHKLTLYSVSKPVMSGFWSNFTARWRVAQGLARRQHHSRQMVVLSKH